MKCATLLFISFCLSGCASLLSGNKQAVLIESNIENVEVYWKGKFMGETPVSVELPRDNAIVLELKKKTYQTRLVKLNAGINSYFWLNLPVPILGTTGLSTDYGGGAIYEFKPDSYMIEMRPLKTTKTSQFQSQSIFFHLAFAERLLNEKARSQHGEASTAALYLSDSQNDTD